MPVPDGRKKALGVAIGAAAADEMIASRVGDGRNNVFADGSTVAPYSKAPAPGIWQPPATGMALYWLGFVKPVIDVKPVKVDGPDPLTSRAYARDYEEVRKAGELNAPLTDRTQEQTDIAKFFANNPVPIYRGALCDLLEAEPMGLLATTRLFAQIDAAVVTTFLQTWRLKYEVGFWRPFQAIAGALTDGNPATNPHPGTHAMGAADRQPCVLRLHQRPRVGNLTVRTGAPPNPRGPHHARAQGRCSDADLHLTERARA